MAENILKEICNRLLNLFIQTEDKEENAKSVACNRLRVVLMQDRTNLTPELLQRMRKELIELLSKYVEMDKDALELNLDQEDGQMALMLSIPVIRAKDEAEIEESLKAENKENEISKDEELEVSEEQNSIENGVSKEEKEEEEENLEKKNIEDETSENKNTINSEIEKTNNNKEKSNKETSSKIEK